MYAKNYRQHIHVQNLKLILTLGRYKLIEEVKLGHPFPGVTTQVQQLSVLC